MSFENLLQPLALAPGPQWKNRFALAPLTNQQSRPDGTLTDEEIRWLTLRARGGFGLVMTAAAHVQPIGQGCPGQLGVFDDEHLPGLSRLGEQLRGHGAASAVQLHHAGARSPADLVGQPVSASDDPESGARALSWRRHSPNGQVSSSLTAWSPAGGAGSGVTAVVSSNQT